MLREISKEKLGNWLNSGEMIHMVINNVVEGRNFHGIANLWLLTIIVKYKSFLVVHKLIERIVEVSSGHGFAR